MVHQTLQWESSGYMSTGIQAGYNRWKEDAMLQVTGFDTIHENLEVT